MLLFVTKQLSYTFELCQYLKMSNCRYLESFSFCNLCAEVVELSEVVDLICIICFRQKNLVLVLLMLQSMVPIRNLPFLTK